MSETVIIDKLNDNGMTKKQFYKYFDKYYGGIRMRKTKEDLAKLKELKAERKSLLDEKKASIMKIKTILNQMREIKQKYKKT